ncbi:hypothetical protein [Novosphingobium sp. BL-52-GroH]|uniref:hypothetical protein n=1 Tax=Novosphingobium sp. BL-52-GroH TaxID=3349877 RepID=UPI00384F1B7C
MLKTSVDQSWLEDGAALSAPCSLADVGFTRLEHQVILLSRHDPYPGIESRRERGLFAAAFGRSKPNALASSRLEALRRLAICLKVRPSAAADDIEAFFAVGFSIQHLDLLRRLVGQARQR